MSKPTIRLVIFRVLWLTSENTQQRVLHFESYTHMQYLVNFRCRHLSKPKKVRRWFTNVSSRIARLRRARSNRKIISLS